MDFTWTQKQKDRRAAIVDFARSELNADILERDAKQEFSFDNWRKCAEMGLMGFPVREEYGGQGMDILTTVYLLEGLGYGCVDNGLIFSINAHIWACEIPVQTFGSDEQKNQFLPAMVRGEKIGVHAVSEPTAGSDALALQSTARREGDEYVLNGHKCYITSAPVGDLFIIVASVDLTVGAKGLTAFLIEKGRPGLRTERNSKMGLRSAIMGEVFLEDCRIPAKNILGREGGGMAIFQHAMEWERAFIMSSAVGSMERLLENSTEHARTRSQFGQPIGKFQGVSHKLVEMKLRLETSRLLLYKTAWLKSQDKFIHMEAALTKYQISESYIANCMDALQIHGACGYITETGIERELRDALGSRMYSGSAEIQKNIVAQFMGL